MEKKMYKDTLIRKQSKDHTTIKQSFFVLDEINK